MAKISPVSIKYVIRAKFEAEGTLEKPDVIGAVFGQTEGLLGSDLELRELQKEGKIGRVDVTLETKDGKTVGEIEIPSALDKAETSIIAAAIETIERMGPSNASLKVEKIEDVRGSKRDYIMERAKKLLEGIEGHSMETRELADSVKLGAREAKLQEYGSEMLPAGDISGEEIIVVEGRADVVNLLRNNVPNVIGMNGSILPETIKTLSREKAITLFVDGDRGGKLIARNVCDNANIDFIAVAPDGKEVEELTGKEILQSLRRKVKKEEFFSFNRGSYSDHGYRDRGDRDDRRGFRNNYNSYENRNDRFNRGGYSDRRFDDRRDNRFNRSSSPAQVSQTVSVPAIVVSKEVSVKVESKPSEKILTSANREKLKALLSSVEGKKKAIILNANLEEIKKMASSSLASSLRKSKDSVYAIVLDGTVTSTVLTAAKDAGCKAIAAKNFASSEETGIELVS